MHIFGWEHFSVRTTPDAERDQISRNKIWLSDFNDAFLIAMATHWKLISPYVENAHFYSARGFA